MSPLWTSTRSTVYHFRENSMYSAIATTVQITTNIALACVMAVARDSRLGLRRPVAESRLDLLTQESATVQG